MTIIYLLIYNLLIDSKIISLFIEKLERLTEQFERDKSEGTFLRVKYCSTLELRCFPIQGEEATDFSSGTFSILETNI